MGSVLNIIGNYTTVAARRVVRKVKMKLGLIATQLSVLKALVFKVNENIHPWTST